MREGPMKAMKSMGKGFPEFSKFAKGFGMGGQDDDEKDYLELPESAQEGTVLPPTLPPKRDRTPEKVDNTIHTEF